MGFLEHITNLDGDLYSSLSRKTALAGKCLRKRWPLDKLHNDEVTAIRQVPGVENHRCMRMPQPGHGPRLTQETLGYVLVSCKLAFDDLYRDRSFQSELSGTIDSTHASGSDFAFNAEPAGDKLGDIHSGPSFGIKGRSERCKLCRGEARVRAPLYRIQTFIEIGRWIRSNLSWGAISVAPLGLVGNVCGAQWAQWAQWHRLQVCVGGFKFRFQRVDSSKGYSSVVMRFSVRPSGADKGRHLY